MTQPYQEASEEVQRQGEMPITAAKTVGGAIAGGAALKAAGKVLPFLSRHIPSNLAIKGLTKADPRYGKFIKKAVAEGTSMDEIKDFIKEKAASAMPKEEEKSKESRNIIEQYDPELHTYILDKIKKGASHIHAGTKALKHERFKKSIKKIMKDHKLSWDQILDSVYGEKEPPSTKKTETQKTPPPSPTPPSPPPTIPQPPPIETNKQIQSTAGQDRLMAALQKLQQIRGVSGS